MPRDIRWGAGPTAAFPSTGPCCIASSGLEHIPCSWCQRPLTWGVDLHTDHLNNIKDDNRPENPAASCAVCNSARAEGRLKGRLQRLPHWRTNRERVIAAGLYDHLGSARPKVIVHKVHPRYKLDAAKVRAIRRRWAAGESQTSLAASFGCSLPNINCVVHRKLYDWVR
jgi:hypothetical protein